MFLDFELINTSKSCNTDKLFGATLSFEQIFVLELSSNEISFFVNRIYSAIQIAAKLIKISISFENAV